VPRRDRRLRLRRRLHGRHGALHPRGAGRHRRPLSRPCRPANAAAIPIALRLLFVAALFQVFDGAQVIAAGALRGLRDTAVPLVIAGIGYWVVGFGSAWLMAFPLGLGALGLWWGLAIGLAAVALPLALRFLTLTLHRAAPAP